MAALVRAHWTTFALRVIWRAWFDRKRYDPELHLGAIKASKEGGRHWMSHASTGSPVKFSVNACALGCASMRST